jgi:hypothetical protein
VNTHRVDIESWVIADLGALPLSRASKLKFLIDLRTYLPANYTRLRGARCENNPACFWYGRMAAEGLKVHLVQFAVNDSDPDVLRVVWLEHVGG